MNYTRQSILQALKLVGKPVNRDDLFKEWIEYADMDLVRFSEQVFTPSGTLMAFHAAILDLLNSGEMYANKSKLCCLKEWKPPGIRNLDDEWQS